MMVWKIWLTQPSSCVHCTAKVVPGKAVAGGRMPDLDLYSYGMNMHRSDALPLDRPVEDFRAGVSGHQMPWCAGKCCQRAACTGVTLRTCPMPAWCWHSITRGSLHCRGGQWPGTRHWTVPGLW
jgi:hypothetical protein